MHFPWSDDRKVRVKREAPPRPVSPTAILWLRSGFDLWQLRYNEKVSRGALGRVSSPINRLLERDASVGSAVTAGHVLKSGRSFCDPVQR